MQLSTYGIVGAIALLVIIVLIIVLNFISKKNKDGAKEFLEGISEELTALAIDIIKGFNPAEYESIEDFENAVLLKVYDKLWDYIQHEIENGKEYGAITKAIAKAIDKDFVIQFIDKLFTSDKIFDVLSTRYMGKAISTEEIEKEDKQLEKSFDNTTEYVEDSEKEGYTLPTNEDELTDEEKEQIANLNPQTDEEKAVSVEDDPSVEYEDEPKETKTEIIKQTTKDGKVVYYEIIDGKKHRVSKAYAATILSPEEL